MRNTVLHELYVGIHPVSVIKNEEGEIFPAYDVPYPNGPQADRIEAYLVAEGLLPASEGQSQGLELELGRQKGSEQKVTIHFTSGITECYRGDTDMINFNEEEKSATLIFAGRIIELEGVASIEN